MNTKPFFLLQSMCALTTLVVAIMSPSADAMQIRASDQPQGGNARLESVHVYQLRNISAAEAAQTLQQLLLGPSGKGSNCQIVADPRTNSLLIKAEIDRKSEIENLIKLLDVRAQEAGRGGPEVVLVPLTNLQPDAELEKMLYLLFQNQPGKFALDRQRKVVVLAGNEQLRLAAQEFLKTLEASQANRPRYDEMQVRIVWLASGLKREDAGAAPTDLADVVAELGKMGIDKPKLVAQLLVSTPMGAPFQMDGTAFLDAPCQLNVVGTLSEKPGDPVLTIEVNAARETRRTGPAGQGGSAGGKVCRLQTQIITPLGHATVLGVTPADGMSSIFVIQVLRKGEAKPK